jgi:dihydropyrimidinase
VDLVIRNATVVTAEHRQVTDLGIEDGRVAQMGGAMNGRRELQARGLYALPGGVDPHVHLTGELPAPAVEEVAWVDDFTSGSAAALAGGITSLGNMTFSAGGSSMTEAVRLARGLVEQQAMADVLLHPVLAPYYPGASDDLARLDGDGHRSLKVFMSMDEFDRHFEDYRRAIRAAAAQGTIVLIHCEDAGVIHRCTAALVARGCGLQHFAESRPPLAEVSAIRRAIQLAEESGATIYIVHLSCAEALAECEGARRRGLPVYVEARPLYLYLTEERYQGPDAGLYVGQPPLRSAADVEALWDGIRRGTIDTLGSDHAPFTAAQKLDPRHTLVDLRPGVAELDTMLPLLFTVGLRERHIPLERLVALTATNPARLFGLYPRKGTIAVGSDADLGLWDLDTARTIEARRLHSRAGYSPYEGMIASAWPRLTLRRGEIVFEEGEIRTRPGQGRLLTRGRSLPV